MSSLSPEFHLAQQIRRDKLRIHNNNNNSNMMLDHEPLYSSQEEIIHSPNWRNTSHPHDWNMVMSNNTNNYATTSSNNNVHSFCLPNVLNNALVLTDPHSSSPTTTTSSGGVAIMHQYQNALQDILNKSPYSSNDHGITEPVLFHSPSYGGFDHNTLPHHQGLSLSLSSNSQQPNPSSERSAAAASSDHHDPQYYSQHATKHGKSVLLHHQGRPVASVGPLGPFTGYATILKSSRFLRPCQQLLDDYCCGAKLVSSEWISGEPSAASAAVDDGESVVVVAGKGGGGVVAGNFCLSSSRPECQKNKATLLYMQEEVTGRYMQFHQQMQMVVSSFESVAGLNSAMPYISLALKSASKHFKCLKNAISDHLKLLCEALGEDSSVAPNTSTSGNFDTNIARRMEQSFQRNKSGNSMELVEPQQHAWRPQRGLPERAVAILKAWLFEHFLHPYPTDSDKLMLATQTGLSRNQVSNWFINARVRVWKPMVEEIHMLEAKGVANPERTNSASEGSSSHHDQPDHHTNKFSGTHVANVPFPERQFHCLETAGPSSSSLLAGGGGNNEENRLNNEEELLQWNNHQEKRSKLECQFTSGMDHGSALMGFMPFRRSGGLEVGGVGPVSLTLGLRHGVEGAQQQQQQQMQQEEQIRRHFGGHMIHDFVG